MWKLPKSPDEADIFYHDLQGAYEKRWKQFAILQQRGAAHYVVGKTGKLWPGFTVLVGVVGLVVTRSDAVRAAMVREVGLAWGMSLLVVAAVLGLVLSALSAVGLWFVLKRRIFPRLPPTT